MLDALSRTVARVAGQLADTVVGTYAGARDDAEHEGSASGSGSGSGSGSASASSPITPIGEHLMPLSRNVVRVSSVVNDTRIRNWLAAVFEDPSMTVSLQACAAQTWQVDIEAREGWLRFNVGLVDLPLALGSAVGTPDRRLACEVATLLLAPVLQRLAPVVTEAQVRTITRCSRVTTGFMFRVGGRKVALTGVDTRLTTHAKELIGTTSVNLSMWVGLQVPGRVRLMRRHWTRDFVASLAAGDIVLLGPGPGKHLFIIGTGMSMQSGVDMDMDEDMLSATDAPVVGQDFDAMPQDASGRLEDLQLPVSFEIDTARVSLGELAAMQADYVIELDVPLKEATVRLVCHGQTIGHGQLVAVGAQVGVRITHMGMTSDITARR